jgi:uncharacterized protein YndB with AHSA1/START domain
MTPNFRSAATQPSDFTLTRSFDASRHLVFRIRTDAKFGELWLGVEGSTNLTCQMDIRPGGAWRIDMRTASGLVYPNGGFYLEVVENERLVCIHRRRPS